ncbi:MAG: tetratricopeptide repeat protein [Acidobacteriota bacterium]
MKPLDTFARVASVTGLCGLVLVCAPSGSPDVVLLPDCARRLPGSAEQEVGISRLLENTTGAEHLAAVTVDYPHDESIFPPEMVAPTFRWHDAAKEADRWLLSVSFAEDSSCLQLLVEGLPPPPGEIDPMVISVTNALYEPTPYEASARTWKPEPEVWETIKAHSVAGTARLTFLGYQHSDPERVLSRGSVTLQTSRDPAGAPIFYRDVPLVPTRTRNSIMPLPREVLPLIKWRLRDLSRPESRVVMRDMPTCANCHSFSADGKMLGMDIDGPSGDKGAYAFTSIRQQLVIPDEEIMTWNSYEGQSKARQTLGFMSQVSPDGKVALSTLNEAIYVRNFPDFKFGQVFYPTRGILAYYSRDTGEIHALPGADDPEYVQTDGVWTPDGETVIFARGKARDPFIRGRPPAQYAGDPNETPMQYDLYRVPFNGGKGGRAEPIVGASANGMSNNFPKVSPDGKWIVFVKCKNGQLMRPDGKLWIVPAAGGEARRMRCNTPLMNSWHSFSPNGRWLVFSSKSNTPYTQLFLTHIDENGDDSPALLIENSTAANRASNIPEFANIAYDDLVQITVPQADYYRDYHRGADLMKKGQYDQAITAFQKALEVTDDSRIHNSLATVMMRLGKKDLAIDHLRESLKLHPANYEVHNTLASLLFDEGEYDEVRQNLDDAIRLYPQQPRAWSNRGMVDLQTGDYAAAIENFDQALRISPRYPLAFKGRGMVFETVGDFSRAVSDFDRAIEFDPDDPTSWYFRALIRSKTGDPQGALRDVVRAREVAPPGMPQIDDIENLHRRIVAMLEDSSRR